MLKTKNKIWILAVSLVLILVVVSSVFIYSSRQKVDNKPVENKTSISENNPEQSVNPDDKDSIPTSPVEPETKIKYTNPNFPNFSFEYGSSWKLNKQEFFDYDNKGILPGEENYCDTKTCSFLNLTKGKAVLKIQLKRNRTFDAIYLNCTQTANYSLLPNSIRAVDYDNNVRLYVLKRAILENYKFPSSDQNLVADQKLEIRRNETGWTGPGYETLGNKITYKYCIRGEDINSLGSVKNDNIEEFLAFGAKLENQNQVSDELKKEADQIITSINGLQV